ncbi:MAG: ATP-dependent DNA helicase RecG [Anaerolineae bacterium]|nr:ATP-dependent DNA helicase RecG [Thermoflexales bacterium]MDW8396200.1 ATP-dependent DNA helicase RecG [Anaerolineae bacterium]
MPNAATEKLLKILKLEAQTGYQDKAVTRGLSAFVSAWLADAERANIDPDWAQAIAQEMREYSACEDLSRRRVMLDAIVGRLRAPVLRAAPVATAPPARPSLHSQPAAEAPPETPTPARSTAAARPERSAPRQPARRLGEGLSLDSPVTKISGIGEFNAQKLARLGVHTIRDLLYYFPTRYDDYSALKTINQLRYGEQVTIVGRVASARPFKTRAGQVIVRVVIEDASGAIECSWFTTERFADGLLKQFTVGREMVISGKVTEYLGRLTFQNPSYEPAEREWITGGNIVPVYRLTEGLQPLLLRRVMRRIVDYWPARVPEHLPDWVRRQAGLVPIAEALREIHFPRSMRSQEAARRRLAFDELFSLQLAVLRQRELWRSEPALPLVPPEGMLERLIEALPFKLTGAQQRAIRAIAEDLKQPTAMHRLLQGDVGSGKTVVAALGMALAASTGAQAALMAPTEILAEQHYKNFSRLFAAFIERAGLPPVNLALLTGSLKPADKRAIQEGLASGEIRIAIGTHALIQEAVAFKQLGFVVVDEQHRFGVEQRAALRRKAGELNPHTLVMTATPIPRTLALTLYGDLDQTVLDEMPPGRQPIETHWIPPTERERAYQFVRHQIDQGRQAYIICPLVEESDKVEAKAAVEEYERLSREIFPGYKLGLLHGKMRPAEKEAAMQAFARGETQILVSTAVVEVGIDVPNATVMLIEGANRFGLAQLHQFRGRVGRGAHKSYCLLFADSSSDLADQRLQAIVNTHDGFKLAEIDLEIRGPGEFFGTRQSGEPELKLVGIGDRDLLETARELAAKLIAQDPDLHDHPLLAEKVAQFWRDHSGSEAS